MRAVEHSEGDAVRLAAGVRAKLRGASRRTRERAEAAASELRNGGLRIERGKNALVQARQEVDRGWRAVGEILVCDGRLELAEQVRRFVEQVPPLLAMHLLPVRLTGRRSAIACSYEHRHRGGLQCMQHGEDQRRPARLLPTAADLF